MTENY